MHQVLGEIPVLASTQNSYKSEALQSAARRAHSAPSFKPALGGSDTVVVPVFSAEQLQSLHPLRAAEKMPCYPIATLGMFSAAARAL